MEFVKKEYFFKKTATSLKKGVGFRNGDRPPSNTFKKLLDSILFKTELLDRAKLDTGAFNPETNGHVVLATDEQVLNDVVQPDDRSLVVQPGQTTIVSSENQNIDDFSDSVLQITQDLNATRKSFIARLSEPFITWLLLRVLPNAGSLGQVLAKASDNDYDVRWQDVEANSLDWSENLLTTSNVLAEEGLGYTAEGGIISLLSLPINITPAEGAKIGIAADSNSVVNVRLEGSTDTYFTVVKDQSAVFRYDISKGAWLVESSHLPVEQTSSTTIYVDEFASPGGDGTIILPYDTLQEARDVVIGTGSRQNPELQDITIIVTSGTFTLTTENLWVNTLTWEFADSVEINHLGNGYLFDNEIENGASNFNITGGLSYITSSLTAGFVNAFGTGTATAKTMTIDCNSITSSTSVASSSKQVPLVNVQSNDGNVLNADNIAITLNLTCNNIVGQNTDAIVRLGPGSRTIFEGDLSIRFSSSAAGDPRTRHLIEIDTIYSFTHNGGALNAATVANVIFIEGLSQNITFNNVTFNQYTGGNSYLQIANYIQLAETFGLENKTSFPAGYGLFFNECSTNVNNYAIRISESPRGGYFIFKEDASNMDLSFIADFKNCDIDGLISLFTPGFFVSNSFTTAFRSNILTHSNSGGGQKVLTYYNIPTSTTGLQPGMIWNNAGVINIV